MCRTPCRRRRHPHSPDGHRLRKFRSDATRGSGYSAKTAAVIGAQNLIKLNVSAAIEKARAERAERSALNADMVVDELRKIGFANMADYMKSTP